MKKLISIIILVLFCGCEKEKKGCYTNFTYSKGNIKMIYRLKFNSSDTVYYLNDNPFQQKILNYFILEQNEKKILDSLICELKFPIKDSVISNNQIEDGTTIAFSIDKKRLMLHGGKGSKKFWIFEKWMDNLQKYKQLKPIDRKVKFDEFDKMFPVPPPIIN
nr:hypothetical protein [uncultured Flavobacterium sp.]